MKTTQIRIYESDHVLVLKIAKQAKKTSAEVMAKIIAEYIQRRSLEVED